MANDLQRKFHFETLLVQAFKPSTPIQTLSLFAGRIDQLQRVIDAWFEPGRHIVLYGDRGVGKTSLANIIKEKLNSLKSVKHSCSTSDTLTNIWHSLLSQIQWTNKSPIVGFREITESSSKNLADYLPNPSNISVQDIVKLITTALTDYIFVIDEYDRIEQPTVNMELADVIKGLSDSGSGCTILIVGVGDDIGQLLLDHPSLARCLMQIRLPEMSQTELNAILENGEKITGLPFTKECKELIVELSLGFPHYTHLLGKYASRFAYSINSPNVDEGHLTASLSACLKDVQHSTVEAYNAAVYSPQPGAKFAQTLLACSLASTDEMGRFKANDIQPILSIIEGKEVILQSYVGHIAAFCLAERHFALKKSGPANRHQYKFSNPLLKAYVLIRAQADGRLNNIDISAIRILK